MSFHIQAFYNISAAISMPNRPPIDQRGPWPRITKKNQINAGGHFQNGHGHVIHVYFTEMLCLYRSCGPDRSRTQGHQRTDRMDGSDLTSSVNPRAILSTPKQLINPSPKNLKKSRWGDSNTWKWQMPDMIIITICFSAPNSRSVNHFLQHSDFVKSSSQISQKW